MILGFKYRLGCRTHINEETVAAASLVVVHHSRPIDFSCCLEGICFCVHSFETPLRLLFELKIQLPVVFAPRIECATALRAFASAVHVFRNGQDVFALPTKHCVHISLFVGPNPGSVRLACIVTADACVELLATEMLDGDDVKRGMPMRALR